MILPKDFNVIVHSNDGYFIEAKHYPDKDHCFLNNGTGIWNPLRNQVTEIIGFLKGMDQEWINKNFRYMKINDIHSEQVVYLSPRHNVQDNELVAIFEFDDGHEVVLSRSCHNFYPTQEVHYLFSDADMIEYDELFLAVARRYWDILIKNGFKIK